MRPLKITIRGDYYDSQIYNDRLYLWTLTGDVITVDWGKLVDSLKVNAKFRIALECAFRRSDYLYGDHWKVFFEDQEIKDVLRSKFLQLESIEFEISEEKLIGFYSEKPRQSPFVFPHADSDIYYNHFIVGSDEGVQISDIQTNKNRGIGSLVYEHDVPAFDISPSNFNLALASGDDGAHTISLIEADQQRLVPDFEMASEPKQIVTSETVDINWMFSNLITSNNGDAGILTELDLPKSNEKIDRAERIERYANAAPVAHNELGQVLEIKHGSIIWGARDKLCVALDGIIDVYSYKPWNSITDLDLIGSLIMPDGNNHIERAESANFAFIIQANSNIQVLQSDEGIYLIRDEVSNWRSFNRSKNFSNQLHVILEDRIEILSFNGDYFVEQDLKLAGLYHNPNLTDQKSKRREYYI